MKIFREEVVELFGVDVVLRAKERAQKLRESLLRDRLDHGFQDGADDVGLVLMCIIKELTTKEETK